MRNFLWITFSLALASFSFSCDDKEDDYSDVAPPSANNQDTTTSASAPTVATFLTRPSGSDRFTAMGQVVKALDQSADVTLDVDPEDVYQQMEGFGFALTGGSAFLIGSMSETEQDNLLEELFGDGDGQIGMSYMRISIGASDLDASVFSYNDLGAGQVDTLLEQFSIAPDTTYLIPIIKKIQSINPDIQLLASPWSAPTWMKTNGESKGGQLKPEYQSVYADYFVKYIQAMEQEGITINAITIQNEPLNPWNNPSMEMFATQQTDFIKNDLGPAFEANNIDTKIITYDHNPDEMAYPISILDDADANPYVYGSGFHLYAGSISNLTQIYAKHPDKALYFTEQWYGADGDFEGSMKWHIREVMIGAARNWCSAVIEWNLASSPTYGPHTVGGCSDCKGALTIDGDVVTRNEGYYVMAHVSKHVVPGSKRINVNYSNDVPNISYLTPDNQVVLIALNDTQSSKTVNVTQGDNQFSFTLDAGALVTHVWDK